MTLWKSQTPTSVLSFNYFLFILVQISQLQPFLVQWSEASLVKWMDLIPYSHSRVTFIFSHKWSPIYPFLWFHSFRRSPHWFTIPRAWKWWPQYILPRTYIWCFHALGCLENFSGNWILQSLNVLIFLDFIQFQFPVLPQKELIGARSTLSKSERQSYRFL